MRRGLAVKVRRTELEKERNEVAFKVGISREYLRLIEAGKAKNPSIGVVLAICANILLRKICYHNLNLFEITKVIM